MPGLGPTPPPHSRRTKAWGLILAGLLVVVTAYIVHKETAPHRHPPAAAPHRSPPPSPRPTISPIPNLRPGACTPPSYAACGFPDASDAGVPPGSALQAKSGKVVITKDGTVIDGWDFSGVIDVEADNVTIRNSRLTGTTWFGIRYGATNPRATGLVVAQDTLQTVPGRGPDHGGYDYGIEQVGHGTLEVASSDISGYKDGVDISNGSVHDSYIHELSTFKGAHDQDIYVWSGGDGVTIEHNTLIADSEDSTAAIYVAPDSGHQNNVTMEDNWLAGGSYCVYGGDTTATNIRLVANAFSPEQYASCGQYGLVDDVKTQNPGDVTAGNVWAIGPRAGQAATP